MIYTGRSKDGSDGKEFFGMHINPNNSEEWSNVPYNEEQRLAEKEYNLYWNVRVKIEGSLSQEYELIKNRASILNRRERDWVINQIKNR